MDATDADPLSLPELDRLLREVDPAVLLVPPRILRRVIKRHSELPGLGLRVPHRKSYILPRDDLLRIATPGELGLQPGQDLPELLLLFGQPDERRLRTSNAGKVLLRCWRMLFHAHVHLAFERLRAAGQLDEAAMRQRVERIGIVAFEEAREVLRQENYLLAAADGAPGKQLWPGDLAAVYEEFAAVYLELKFFDPHRREQFFPGADFAAVEEVLAGDIDGEELFLRTRPRGALDPAHVRPEPEPVPDESSFDSPEKAPPGWLRSRAELAARRGNQVRAAILRYRAIPLSPPGQAGGLRAGARLDIEALVNRLHRALDFPAAEKPDWTRCLLALLQTAAGGVWNIEARLLYDLQKVCVDCERELYAVDLIEWLVSWFQRPIKRRLPDQPLVLTVKHLRTAAGRLSAARLGAADRERLGELLHAALHHAEVSLRERLRPRIAAALDAVGLAPPTLAERLARDKVVEELLDRIAEEHQISIGDVRDALARNRLKLPDLRGPVELVAGDPLIRVNRRLACDLDGIYRRGEIYLRWMQRLSSLFFGNPVGRALTLFLILPILGSLFILKGIDGISEEAYKFLGLPELHTFNNWSFAALALFLLPMLHWPAFRRGVGHVLYSAWRVVRAGLYDLPLAFLALPLVRHITQSKPYILFYQFLAKPLLWTAPLTGILYLAGAPPAWNLALSAAVLVLVSALINTRAGMIVEETTADWLVHTWQMVRDDLFPGLFRWIQWASRRARESIELFMYSVDEWLRFRSGEGRLSFAAKLVLGLVWFCITYVVRFAVNLLIEPQINPIKHFPVVTVSHKLMLLIAQPIAEMVHARLGISMARATTLTVTALSGVPGIFGFLAWELKENWRLYRANQSPTLDPVIVGGHGEHVIHLIRPGFHAGTLPKLYARLRRSKGKAERKTEEGLHHVEEAVRRFVERDLVADVGASHAWAGTTPLRVGEILLATNRIRFELRCPDAEGGALSLEMSNRGGWLVARVVQPGWLPGLSRQRREAFHDALVGFYKLSGVDVVHEQMAAALPAGCAFDVGAEGVTVWPTSDPSCAVTYDLSAPERPPRGAGCAGLTGLPPSGEALVLARSTVPWAAWVEQWERDREGKEHSPPLLPEVHLLPVSA
jgi:hypothetical protein